MSTVRTAAKRQKQPLSSLAAQRLLSAISGHYGLNATAHFIDVIPDVHRPCQFIAAHTHLTVEKLGEN